MQVNQKWPASMQLTWTDPACKRLAEAQLWFKNYMRSITQLSICNKFGQGLLTFF